MTTDSPVLFEIFPRADTHFSGTFTHFSCPPLSSGMSAKQIRVGFGV
jgi:hypothetical protein